MRLLIGFLVCLGMGLAQAETLARCGKDSFGNLVCLDKDGVMVSAPHSTAKTLDSSENSVAASAVSAEEIANRQLQQQAEKSTRCGIDSFGNRVCQ